MTTALAQYAPVNREAIFATLYEWLVAHLTAPPWAASTSYTEGVIVTDPQGHLQLATNSGESGSASPIWNDLGGTTLDNGITWQDTGAGFIAIGRKHRLPPDLIIAEQPALFLVQVKNTYVPQQPPGMTTKLAMHGFLILYFQGPAVTEKIGEETLLADTEMNALLFAIDQVFIPDNLTTGKFTIGGLVTHCWIQGDANLDPGILGTQCAAILPLHILVD